LRPARDGLRGRLPLLLLMLAVVVCVIMAAAASASAYTTLKPGETTTISQALKVNVVLLGFEAGTGMQQVDQAALLSGLPTALDQPGESLEFTYRYNLIQANKSFEDRFFAYLSSIAVDKPLTSFQQAYNDQLHSSLDVTDNSWIDGPSVERWLGSHEKDLGIERREYTVFLVNWYGRPDFRFHIYVKTNEPDPDTGANMGRDQDYTKTIAWGGTAADDPQDGQGWLRRLWFCDLSAGPDSYSGSWNVDDQVIAPGTTLQLPPGGAPCYRIPPIWEYGNTTGYRPFTDLTGDLAKLVGTVAVKGLFTSDLVGEGDGGNARLSSPGQPIPSDVQAAVSMFNLVPGEDGAQYLQRDFILRRIAELQPWRRFSTSYQELQGAALTEGQAAYESWLYWWFSGFSDLSQSIYPETYPDNATFIGDLQIYTRKYLDQLIDTGSPSFQIPVLAFSLPDEDAAWIYGFSFHDPTLGRPATYSLTTAIERYYIGYGLTTTTVHEFGHNLGLDHPHDVPGVGGVPRGADFYMWTGSESNSMMSYIDTNWDFGQFDQDNSARNMTAIYLNDANQLLGSMAGKRLSPAVRALLAKADGQATAALGNYRGMQYQSAAAKASKAYYLVLDASRLAGTARASARTAAAASKLAAAAHQPTPPSARPVGR